MQLMKMMYLGVVIAERAIKVHQIQPFTKLHFPPFIHTLSFFLCERHLLKFHPRSPLYPQNVLHVFV